MDDQVASRTAMAVSLGRALHTRLDPLPLIDDPWGERLVPPAIVEGLGKLLAQHVATTDDTASPDDTVPALHRAMRVMSSYANAVLRARVTEDALDAALARGVRQYVVIGAGLDSYALRQGARATVRVFEVDHPATQSFKLARLRELGVSLPAAAVYLPADLSVRGLGDVLAESVFDPTAPAFFAWLGVTMYLTREANLAALAAIADCAAPGSELVFTYLDEAVFAGGGPSTFATGQRVVAALAEPWLSGFDPASLGVELASLGLDLVEDVADVELAARYDPDARNGFLASATSRTARVIVR